MTQASAPGVEADFGIAKVQPSHTGAK